MLVSNLSDLIERARHCREHGSFDKLHGELLDMVEFLEGEYEAERDRAAEHFDGLMELRTRYCGERSAYCECAKANGHAGSHRCRECGEWPSGRAASEAQIDPSDDPWDTRPKCVDCRRHFDKQVLNNWGKCPECFGRMNGVDQR